eukprot:6193455-Pleurochrysis_carterae.AAC.3
MALLMSEIYSSETRLSFPRPTEACLVLVAPLAAQRTGARPPPPRRLGARSFAGVPARVAPLRTATRPPRASVGTAAARACRVGRPGGACRRRAAETRGRQRAPPRSRLSRRRPRPRPRRRRLGCARARRHRSPN